MKKVTFILVLLVVLLVTVISCTNPTSIKKYSGTFEYFRSAYPDTIRIGIDGSFPRGSLEGKVNDLEGNPLEGVWVGVYKVSSSDVIIKNEPYQLTDEDGKVFLYSNIPAVNNSGVVWIQAKAYTRYPTNSFPICISRPIKIIVKIMNN